MGTVTGSILRTRAEEALTTSADLDSVAAAVFEVVAAEVPFAFACLAALDPASGLTTRAVKSHPLDVGDEDFAAEEWGEPDVNQFSEIATRPVPVGVLSIDTDGAVGSCRRFRDYMAPRFGFTDELRLVCRAGSTGWGALGLYRGAGEPPFTQRDAQVVARVHDVIAGALMRVLVEPARAASAPIEPTVLVLDESDRVDSASSPVADLVDALGGWESGSLPAPLIAAAAAARTAGATTTSRIRTAAGDWLGVRAVPVSTLGGVRSVVLTVETPPSAAIGRLRLAAHGLTNREVEIVQQVLLGASTKEMASALHLSAHTVQDHLKAVFAKLGIGSRRELIAQFVD